MKVDEEQDLIRSCLLANADAESSRLELELDAIADPIGEPWDDPTPG